MSAKLLRQILGTLAIPMITLLVLLALCAAGGTSLFASGDSFLLLTRGVAITMLTAMALSINLNSGRFDFSLGAMATLSSVIGTTTALSMGGGFATMLVVSLASGLALGAISGLVYVTLRISPMVCSLGITLLYEGVSFAITGGANVSFLLASKLTSFAKSPWNMIAVIVVALTAVYLLFDRSRFGFNYRALISGQQAAQLAGANERLNAVATYTVSGGLMSVVGVILASQMGYIGAGTLNFGSIGIMFTAFLPMFIGSYIGRFSNEKLGLLLGALSTTLVGLALAALHASSTIQSVTNALLLVAFLIFLSNEDRLRRVWRRHIAHPRRPSSDGPLLAMTSGVQ